jgi:hypothetical protein
MGKAVNSNTERPNAVWIPISKMETIHNKQWAVIWLFHSKKIDHKQNRQSYKH